MHESFHLEETLPLPPGTSPFHVRGVIYASIIHGVGTLPGGMERFLDELVDVRVRDFMRQKFQFMGWYDVYPALPCAVAIARLRGRPFEAFVREAAKDSMLRLVPSMFRIFSRLGGPRLAAAHAPRLFQTYYDFVDLRLSRVGNEEGTGVITGIPRYVAPQIINHVIGIIAGALESLGATHIEASYRDVTTNGSSFGVELVTCRADFRWRLATRGLRA
ncbi:MAG TPA: hypothetical protein VHC69_28135 [Polyangiaceae bacterium]|nr:hypothetical protein [Polyangiaceae bacterium]